MKSDKLYRPSFAFIGIVVAINIVFVMIFGLAFKSSDSSSSSSSSSGVPHSSDGRMVPCDSSTNSNSGWLWRTNVATHPSCSSPSGGVNDQGWVPTMCEDDISSVRTVLITLPLISINNNTNNIGPFTSTKR